MSPDEQRAYRSNPQGRKCACDEPAVKWHRGGWVCGRCLALEAIYYKGGAENNLCRQARCEGDLVLAAAV